MFQLNPYIDIFNPYIDISKKNNFLFNSTCVNGRLEVAKWLFELNSQFNPDIAISEKLFHDVCMKGHLEVAKWLFELNPNIDFSKNNNFLFVSACQHGKIFIVEWLFSYLNLNPNFNLNIITDNVFHNICIKENLEVAEWLVFLTGNLEYMKFLLQLKSDIDLSRNNEYWFRHVCANGYLELAQWMIQFKPDINISINKNEAFRIACKNGELELAKWLETIYPEKYKIIGVSEENVISYKIIYPLKISGVKLIQELNDCGICYEANCEIITKCNHSYCEACISEWLACQPTCPICRTDLVNDEFRKLEIKK